MNNPESSRGKLNSHMDTLLLRDDDLFKELASGSATRWRWRLREDGLVAIHAVRRPWAARRTLPTASLHVPIHAD
jgi:hypothetical protein